MNQWADWEQIPETINKEQFYQICHISKQTARYLLKSGKVPCEYNGKKTRCYKIKKEDVQAYLFSRGASPEDYAAPAGWYSKRKKQLHPEKPSAETLQKMRDYYGTLLNDYPDVMTVQQVVHLTGYAKTTVNNWCSQKRLPSFMKDRTHYIPKVFLNEFFCSEYFRTISRKTKWHLHVIRVFQRQLKEEVILAKEVCDNA